MSDQSTPCPACGMTFSESGAQLLHDIFSDCHETGEDE